MAGQRDGWAEVYVNNLSPVELHHVHGWCPVPSQQVQVLGFAFCIAQTQ